MNNLTIDQLQDEWLKVPLSEKQLDILQHSLGVDQYGQGTQYRNRFVTGFGSDDWPLCVGLCALGLMEDHGAYAMCGGDHVFMVTAKGVKVMKAQSPKPPKLTRSQRRYREFLDADSGLSFKEWITMRHWRGSHER